MDRRWNYRAYNPVLDKDCGHNHHSRESASACAGIIGWESVAKIIQIRVNKHRKPCRLPKKGSKIQERAESSNQVVKKQRQLPRRKKRFETGEDKIIIPEVPIILPKEERPKAREHPVDMHRDPSYFAELREYNPYFPDWIDRPFDNHLLEMRASAMSGDAYAQYRMGMFYEENRISCTKAVYWYNLSAKNGCEFAVQALGRILYSEENESLKDTIEMMDMSPKDSLTLCRLLQSVLPQEATPARLKELSQRALQSGDNEAYSFQGEMLLKKEDSIMDGLDLLKKAIAETESSRAMYVLGKHYIDTATKSLD